MVNLLVPKEVIPNALHHVYKSTLKLYRVRHISRVIQRLRISLEPSHRKWEKFSRNSGITMAGTGKSQV